MSHPERDLQEIQNCHNRVHRCFYSSIPGALWAIEQITIGGMGEKILHFVKQSEPIDSIQTISLSVALLMWWLPFEVSEYSMVELKNRIRTFMDDTGEATAPINYTWVDKTVNTVMKLAHDRTPLP